MSLSAAAAAFSTPPARMSPELGFRVSGFRAFRVWGLGFGVVQKGSNWRILPTLRPKAHAINDADAACGEGHSKTHLLIALTPKSRIGGSPTLTNPLRRFVNKGLAASCALAALVVTAFCPKGPCRYMVYT